MSGAIRVAVVGHVEWVTFARVPHMPSSGEIVHASDDFELPAGGGPVTSMQLLELAGNCTLFTAFGDDELGHRAHDELKAFGLRVESVFRKERQRRAFTHVDERTGERTITVIGERLGPHAADPLPWDELDGMDAVFFSAGDDDAFRLARGGRVLVGTTREAGRIARVGQYVDAVVGSGKDPSERYIDTSPHPGLIVETLGAVGGQFRTADGADGVFGPGSPPGPVVCAYGAGDCFVGGLTYALGSGMKVDAALELASDAGAACLSRRGPYEGRPQPH